LSSAPLAEQRLWHTPRRVSQGHEHEPPRNVLRHDAHDPCFDRSVAKSTRHFSTPFWVTVAALIPACGGTVVPDDDQNGGGTGERGGRPGSNGGSPGSGGGITSSTPLCDIGELLYSNEACTPGDACYLDTECTDETSRTFDFECLDGVFAELALTGPLACSNMPYAQCRALEATLGCEEDHWSLLPGGEYNPPGPCPAERPAIGDGCSGGEFGGDPPYCGYACSGGWEVMHCPRGEGGATGEVHGPPAEWETEGCTAGGGASNE